MHILVTADTVGGVWTYTRELVTGLASRGIRITLVSFGGIPAPPQTAWLEKLSGVTYFPTAFRLEWMQDSASDIIDSTAYLHGIIEELKPDLLHLGQFCYGSMDVPLPKILVAHSDVMSWSQTVRGVKPDDSWARWYRRTVEQGLAGASMVVAPSHWMLDCIDSCYGKQQRSRVIYNGRSPALFNPLVTKHNYAASVGRLWDEGKQSQLLLHLTDSPLPIFLAGAESLADEPSGKSRKLEPDADRSAIKSRGQLSEGEMRQLLSRASIYVATSKYEPFGLAPLEAALSRCALVASDIPSFREIWNDAAFYFIPGDIDSLRNALTTLQGERGLRLDYANRAYQRASRLYTADRMVEEYAQLYSALLERRMSAA
ncbi:MAG TPA: glycosyltransferase family 4 protein [Candidatus Saccharimonadales bacterium]|nr:glycosyltransferase family 4 protein [Candidatus Saccharimonadales bacterium]